MKLSVAPTTVCDHNPHTDLAGADDAKATLGRHTHPAFLFNLDGTLVDSVYQHVLSWKDALDAQGTRLCVWRIHRKIGMSGGLFTKSAPA